MSDEVIISLIFSILSFLVSILTYNYTKNHNNKQFSINEVNNINKFSYQFKEELNQFRIGLTEVIVLQKEINLEEKDNYLYLMESKYSKKEITSHFGRDFYNKFIDLKIKLDDAIDEIIYNKRFNKAKDSIIEIRFLYDDINNNFRSL